MVKVTFNNKVIAESAKTVQIEGNHYFPPGSVKMEYFKPTELKTICGWKGTASYWNITVDGKTEADACWAYMEPKESASKIKGHIAFYKNKVDIAAS